MRVSYSDIYLFDRCPFSLKKKKMKQWEQESTKEMLLGQYLHALLDSEEEGKKWIQNNADVVIGNKGKKNEAVKKDYTIAPFIVEALKGYDFVAQTIEGSEHEIKLIVDFETVTISGILDNFIINHEAKNVIISDWKSVGSFGDYYDGNTQTRVPWYFRYVSQLRLYAYLVKEYFGVYDYEFTLQIVGFSKTTEPNVQRVIFDVGDEEVPEVFTKLEYISKAMELEDDQLDFCGSCECCAKFRKVKMEDLRHEI